MFARNYINKPLYLRTIILMVSSAGLVLAGCTGRQSDQSEIYRLYVKIVSNKVCITLPQLKNSEKLLSFYISERGNDAGYLMRQYPWRKGKYLAAEPGKCVPDFNFPYVAGRRYDMAIQVANPAETTLSGATQGRVYSGVFILWCEGRRLHACNSWL